MREGIERNPGRPGVVDGNQRAMCMGNGADGRDVRHFHRHGARRFGPDQAGIWLHQCGDPSADGRVVIPRRDAKIALQPIAEFAVRVVDIVRQEHVVAAFQHRKIDQRNRRQAARRKHAAGATFNRRQPRFERERGRRAVQAVGVAALVLPVTRPHRRDVFKQHSRRMMDRRGKRGKSFRWGVVAMDQARLQRFLCAQFRTPSRDECGLLEFGLLRAGSR